MNELQLCDCCERPLGKATTAYPHCGVEFAVPVPAQSDTQATAARLKTITNRLERGYPFVAPDTLDDLRFLSAHVETLTQQVAQQQLDVESLMLTIIKADNERDQAEQQRDAAHAALRTWRTDHKGCKTGLPWGDNRCGLCIQTDAALAASAPQKAQPMEWGNFQEMCDGCRTATWCAHFKQCLADTVPPAPAQETER